MTPNRAAGILRRRRAYLVDHVIGKHGSNLPHRHEDQEIEALDVALAALDLNRGCPVTPDVVPSSQPSPPTPRR